MGYFIFDGNNNYKCWVAAQDEVSNNTEANYTVVEGDLIEHPKLENGVVVQDTAIIAELEEENIRAERNGLLNESDREMLKIFDTATSWDNLETLRSSSKTYRQALRDVPTQTDFPSNVAWPTKPT